MTNLKIQQGNFKAKSTFIKINFSFHLETKALDVFVEHSHHLIFRALQLPSFYMVGTLVINELNHDFDLIISSHRHSQDLPPQASNMESFATIVKGIGNYKALHLRDPWVLWLHFSKLIPYNY